MKMSLIRLSVLPAAAFAALTAFADTPVYDATTGFATCISSASKTWELCANTNWSNSADWQDANTPPANTNYYIAAGRGAKGGPYVDHYSYFTPTLYVAGTLVAAGTTADNIQFSDLHMLPGSRISASNVCSWRGPCYIESTATSDPVTFWDARDKSGDSNTFKMRMNVIGAADAKLRITVAHPDQPRSMVRSGDWSAYYGSCTVGDGYKITSESTAFTMPGTLTFGDGCTYTTASGKTDSFGSLTFGDNATVNGVVLQVAGAFSAGTNGTVKLSDGSRFGDFSLGAGTTVDFDGTEPTISVTSSLALGAGVTFNYKAQKASMYKEDPFLPVASLAPACVTAGLPSLEGTKATVTGFPNDMPRGVRLDYRDDSEVPGGKLLGIAFNRVVTNITGNVQADCQTASHATLHRFLGDGETGCWSDGLFPHAGCDYYSANNLGICPNCVLPEALIFGDGLGYRNLFVTGNCAPTDLKLNYKAIVYCRYGGSATLNGRIGLYSDAIVFQGYQTNLITLNSDVYGTGGFDFRSYYPETGKNARIRLNGDNSAWSGGLKFSYNVQSGKTYNPNETATEHVRVYVGNSNALGGGTAAFDYDKIQLNSYGEIIVENTSAFANANRGVYVNGNGAIGVNAGQVATFAAPFTMNGVLRKNGAGTLVLGGGVRYGLNNDLGDATAPTAEKNVILVNEGSIAGTIAGAAITFADGTGVAAGTAGMTDLSGSTITAAGELTVTLNGEFAEGQNYPVLRLTTAQATALGASIRAVRPASVRGCDMTLTGAIDGDDTVYSVRFARRGIAIMFK